MLTVDNPSKFDWKNMELSKCCEGNAMDAYFTRKLFLLIKEKMEEHTSMKLIEKVVMPSIETFADMEYNGLDVDPNKLQSVGKQLRDLNVEQEDALYYCKGVKKTDNLSSNNDLIEILYTREEGMGLYPPDRTGKEKPSVAAATLKLLLEQIDEELSKRG
jgi:DNA polymerase I-like protein with 3'-5' exonuclease and polymerase domains